MTPLIPAVWFDTQIGLGGLFIWSGLAKLFRGGVRSAIEDYRLLPNFVIGPFAFLLPWLELATGATLLSGWFSPFALTAAAFLLALFSVAMAVNLLRGRKTACGCQGRADQIIGWPLIGRNSFLAVCAVATAIAAPALGVSILFLGGGGLSPGDAWAALLLLITCLLGARLTVAIVRLASSLGVLDRPNRDHGGRIGRSDA